MRLIDADDCEKYFYEHLDDAHMIAALNAISEMPTVDAVPVKRGKWNVDGVGLIATGYKCSECVRVVFDENGYDVAKDYPFCPCGAKMERWC